MTTGIKIYITFVAMAALSLIGLMFYLERKMIIPSLFGVMALTGLIVLQMKYMEKKSWDDQKRIATRNGRVASAVAWIMLFGLFYFGAKHNGVPLYDFVKLWFGF